MHTFVTRLAGPVIGVLALVSAGCGGDVTEEEAIASDACDLYAELVDGDIEALFDGELATQFEQLEQRSAEADLSDADIEAAIRTECPGVIEDLEELLGGSF